MMGVFKRPIYRKISSMMIGNFFFHWCDVGSDILYQVDVPFATKTFRMIQLVFLILPTALIFLKALDSGHYYQWLITWAGLAELESAYYEVDDAETDVAIKPISEGRRSLNSSEKIKVSLKKVQKTIRNKHDSDLFFGIFEDFGQLLITTINSLVLGKTLTYM